MSEKPKVCSRCKLTKTESDFHKHARAADGLQVVCKACQKLWQQEKRKENPAAYAARNKAWRKRNPERNAAIDRKGRLKNVYGITEDDFERMLQEQNNKCGLCAADEPKGHGNWHIDHDHETGKVRALLCHYCNIGMGALRDSPALLRAAANYIEHHKELNENLSNRVTT